MREKKKPNGKMTRRELTESKRRSNQRIQETHKAYSSGALSAAAVCRVIRKKVQDPFGELP